jgi:putative transposase
MHWFMTLAEVRRITQQWLNDYNYERPHESLANLPPITFANQQKQILKGEKSTSD